MWIIIIVVLGAIFSILIALISGKICEKPIPSREVKEMVCSDDYSEESETVGNSATTLLEKMHNERGMAVCHNACLERPKVFKETYPDMHIIR